MAFETDVLRAFGSADYLSSLEERDLRKQLREELFLAFAFSHQSREEQEAFIRRFLLLPDHVSADEFIRKTLSGKSPGQFLSGNSEMMEEFIWLDDEFSRVNPSMKFKNSLMLKDLFEELLPDCEEAEHFLSRIRPRSSKEDGLQRLQPLDFHALLFESGNPDSRESKKLEKREKEDQKIEDRQGVEISHESKLEELLHELNRLTGLEGVKSDIQDQIAWIEMNRIRKAHGLKVPSLSHHMVFTGNPGTGKTTVARLLAQIYKELGVLSRGQLVECDRSSLVAGYIGQTAEKTGAMIKKSLGGILFIDEAYALARKSPNDFGKEAIETLLKAMEDHREDWIVIAAGYPDLMEEFLDSNPGFRSRFSKTIYFEDYTADELMQIIERMAQDLDYRIDEKAKIALKEMFEKDLEEKKKGFANARTARNVLEQAMMRQARRQYESQRVLKKDDLQRLSFKDFFPGK